jgi:hypothetical protein
MPLHPLDAETWTEALTAFGKVGDKVRHRSPEFPLLLRT